jgi:hypothetical protein
MPLEGPDQLHLRAATGYIELGMFEEANAELEKIDPFCRHLPEVLLARLAIYHGLEKWELLAVVAKKLTEWNSNEPGFIVELAYATRRRGSIHAAHAILTRAAGLHPTDPTHVFGDDAATIERSIIIDGRRQYPQVVRDEDGQRARDPTTWAV